MDKDSLHPQTVFVDREIYSALQTLVEQGSSALQSPNSRLVKELLSLRTSDGKAAAEWVKEHPLRYGIGYFNGFYPENPLDGDRALMIHDLLFDGPVPASVRK